VIAAPVAEVSAKPLIVGFHPISGGDSVPGYCTPANLAGVHQCSKVFCTQGKAISPTASPQNITASLAA
jgi:hypothetical protein